MTILTRRGVLPVLVTLGSMALYAATMMRTPGWLDDTLILSLANTGEVTSWVNNHTLFNLLGYLWLRAWWFVEPHSALTLLCGLFASLSVLFACHAGREVTGNPAAGALAAAALAVSHSLWWHATVIEVYSLNAAFITLDLFLLARYFRRRSFPCLFAAFVLFGVGVFNHVLMGLFVFAYGALFVMLLAGRERVGWRRGLLLVGAAVIGFVPYLVVFARDVILTMPGIGFRGAFLSALDNATGAYFRQSMFPRNLSGGERAFWRLNYLFLLWYNFPFAALSLAAWGTVRLRRREYPLPFAVFFWLALAAQVTWSSNYLIFDMYAFSMPVYVLASLPLALGIHALLNRAGPLLKGVCLASLLLPTALYPLSTAIPQLDRLGQRYVDLHRPTFYGLEKEYAAARPGGGGLLELTAGLWDPYRYLMNPAKGGYREVVDYCEGILKRLPPNAHFWDDEAKGGYPLRFYYQGIRGDRPDVQIHVVAIHETVDREMVAEEAEAMRSALTVRGEIYTSTLERPEKELVIALSRLMNSRLDAASMRRMGTGEFIRSVPGLAVTEVPLGTRPGLVIYRIRPR